MMENDFDQIIEKIKILCVPQIYSSCQLTVKLQELLVEKSESQGTVELKDRQDSINIFLNQIGLSHQILNRISQVENLLSEIPDLLEHLRQLEQDLKNIESKYDFS